MKFKCIVYSFLLCENNVYLRIYFFSLFAFPFHILYFIIISVCVDFPRNNWIRNEGYVQLRDNPALIIAFCCCDSHSSVSFSSPHSLKGISDLLSLPHTRRIFCTLGQSPDWRWKLVYHKPQLILI